MEELFRKYCVFYASNGSKEELESLNNEAGEKAGIYQKKSLKFIKNLRHKVKKIGYDIDFESFCNLLEEYISKKVDLTDDEKRTYLKALFSMSKIYEINLREELEKYVSYQKVSSRQITERDVFRQFCLYNLHPNNDVSEFNRLKSICEVNNLDFSELQKISLIFVEEIKAHTESKGFSTSTEDINKMIEKYNNEKKRMTDQEKSNYLKVLLYLCEIYNLDLRNLIVDKKKQSQVTNVLSINPLDNKKMMNQLIKERYENGSFKIENFTYQSYIIKEPDYNFITELSLLAYNIYQIFIDKFTNYAYEDLNPNYSSLLTEEDIIRLQEITPEELEKIIIELEKHESNHYICKKFKLPTSLLTFLTKSIYETINIKTPSIGSSSQNLFHIKESKNNIAIYLNGPDKSIIELLKKYIRKCIEQNIDYELDGLCYDNHTFKTIIYSNKADFKKKIAIIKDILTNNPYISTSLVPPLPFSCHQEKELFSISRRSIFNAETTVSYFTYLNSLLEVSYYRSISKIIISRVTNESDCQIINHLIDLNNVSCPNLNPIDATFECLAFSVIKDTINNYIPLISNTISKYLTDNDYQDDLINEFNKAILYIGNIIEGKDKHQKRNITIDN